MTPEIMKPVWAGALAFVLVGPAAAEMQVSFPTSDGGLLNADQYRKGARGVVLAHGGRFNRQSWGKQAQLLASTGFRALALDFSGAASHATELSALSGRVGSTCWQRAAYFAD